MEYNDYFNYDTDVPRTIIREKYINVPAAAAPTQSDDKMLLYFIIILLVCTIIVMNSTYQQKMFELVKKQVKVI